MEAKPNGEGPATSTEAPKAPAGAPDKYEFKAPEGSQLDARAIEEFSPIARELGLSNDQAQKLVDLYSKNLSEAIGKVTGPDANKAVLDAKNAEYMRQAQSDPELGGKLDQVKMDIGRAFDVINKPELRAAFQREMDASPEGNNPAFVKMFHALAKKVIEGKPVSPGNPSPHGQTPSGQQNRPSIAEAMFPHLAGNRPN